YQRVIGMNKRLFAPRISPRGAATTNHNVDAICDLRQRVSQLRIMGIEHSWHISQWTSRRCSNSGNSRLVNRLPQQVTAHQPRCACNQYLTHLRSFTELSALRSPAHAPGLIDHEVIIPDCEKFASSNATTRRKHE